VRIVVAPDKLKGTLSAAAAAHAIERGLRAALPTAEIIVCPMADGGEGTVAAFLDRGYAERRVCVQGPLGDPVVASYALRDRTAIIEMAAASGLQLVAPEHRDIARASTAGTGDLVRAALDDGARHVILGIGGSATNDAGAGFAQALGVRLRDRAARELPAGGAALERLDRIDRTALDARLRDVVIEAACDVDSPLLGPSGATMMFGAQKGASADDARILEAALRHFADVVERDCGRHIRDIPGVGSAGGLGFGLLAFAGARLRPGVEVIADVVGLADALTGADYCITAEGRIDRQTLRGKTVAGVARFARACKASMFAFAGAVEPDAQEALAREGVVCLPITNEPLSAKDAGARAAPLLEQAARSLGSRLRRP